ENYAKFVTYSLYQDQHNADPRVRNSNLLRIGVIAQHCVGRYMKGLTEMYQDLSGNIRITTLDDEIKEAYHERRQGLINHLITEHIRVHPGDGGMFMSHTQNDFAKFIGRARGVVGSRAAEFADPYTRRINENAAITSFDALYTPAFILQRGSWMLNGLVDTRNENQDPSMRIHRTFDTDQINSWFQNHIPDGWEPRQGLPEGMANMDRGDLFRMSCIDHHGLVKKCAIEYMLTHLDILQGDLDVSQIQVDHATLEMLCLV
ncbi:MAG: hypothetical protein KAR79_05640, partial [Simkaniaceae bacterium]|nr:hypothetical protein [Simkaniaceae bacterium]